MGRDNITRTGARAPGVKRETACTEVFISALPLTQSREPRRTQRARRAMANQCSGKAAPEIPALKPYRGNPAVRNFREGDGNVGIIRSPLRAITLPDRRRARTVLCGGRSAMIVPTATLTRRIAILRRHLLEKGQKPCASAR
jgi:hypothetical protein